MDSFPVQGLPFEVVKHQVSTLDVQTTVHDGIIILVTGQLLVSGISLVKEAILPGRLQP